MVQVDVLEGQSHSGHHASSDFGFTYVKVQRKESGDMDLGFFAETSSKKGKREEQEKEKSTERISPEHCGGCLTEVAINHSEGVTS